MKTPPCTDSSYPHSYLLHPSAGYSNNHMGYFATPNEYDVGGYESQLTFWGRNTSVLVRDGAYQVAKLIKP